MGEGRENPAAVSTQALQRMTYYLQVLKKLQAAGVTVVAAPYVAEAMGFNEVQVRKDFALASPTGGRPKSGFDVGELVYHMERLLGRHNVNDAVLVGAGSLGRALLSYRGFDGSGLHIAAAFDVNPDIVGGEINRIKVYPVERLSEMCAEQSIRIGIITVPAEQAQPVCDRLVAGGILAVWNFAPVRLTAPRDILIRNENMAASLAVLAQHLKEKLEG